MRVGSKFRAVMCLVTTAVVFLSAGCGGGGAGGGGLSSTLPVQVRSNVIVLPSDGSMTITSSTATSLTLTGNVPAILPGDVLVCSLGTGFIRNVVSALSTSGVVTVQTTNGSLASVFQQATITEQETLGSGDYASAVGMNGASVGPGVASVVKGHVLRPHTGSVEALSFNNFKIQQGSTTIATLNGSESFSVSLGIQVAINSNGVSSATFTPTVSTSSNLTIDAGTTGSYPTTTVQVAQLTGNPIDVTVGGIPLVFTPTVNLYVEADGQVEAGINLTDSGTATIASGVAYGSGSWSAVQNSAQSLGITPSIATYANADYHVTPLNASVSVVIDGDSGTTADVDCPKLTTSLAVSSGSATLQISGDLDGNASFAGTIVGQGSNYSNSFGQNYLVYNQAYGSTPVTLGNATAVLNLAQGADNGFNVPGVEPAGLTATNYVPVAIQITASQTAGFSSEMVEYHVYRPDFVDVPTSPAGFGDLPVDAIPTQGSLTYYDDGAEKVAAVNKPNPTTPDTLLTADLNGSTPGTAIGVALIGERFQYSIEALYQDISGNYHLSPQVTTNYVTYLQPADLESEDFNVTNPNAVQLSIPATLGADDYTLQVTPDASDFNLGKSYSPYDPSLIQAQSATQQNPREGNQFAFFNPSTGYNLAGDFQGINTLFARVGVRDSRNGTNSATNPYIFSGVAIIPMNGQ